MQRQKPDMIGATSLTRLKHDAFACKLRLGPLLAPWSCYLGAHLGAYSVAALPQKCNESMGRKKNVPHAYKATAFRGGMRPAREADDMARFEAPGMHPPHSGKSGKSVCRVPCYGLRLEIRKSY